MTAIATLPRLFRWCGADLGDPDPNMNAVDVRNLYASTYPELTNAALEAEKVEDGFRVIEFKKKVGTKG